jgi:hypothetical protein
MRQFELNLSFEDEVVLIGQVGFANSIKKTFFSSKPK